MRVLIVEDDPRLGNTLAKGLREQAYAVDVAADGERALGLSALNSYDAIVLDVMLPRRDGLEVCRALRNRGSRVPVLMLTARDTVHDKITGLDAGADDYLTKPFAVAELLARVRALVRRKANKLGRILSIGDIELDRHRRIVNRDGNSLTLTGKEFAVLEFLMMRAPGVVSRTELIEHVWDAQFDTETNLVEVYINRLRQKMGLPRVIQTVHGTGYCLRTDS